MRRVHSSAWGWVVLSAVLQVVIFPLADLYWLSWIAVTPLLIALLRARQAGPLQIDAPRKLVPATPWQGFVLAYACGTLWNAGTCYWVFDTMHRYGGLPIPAAAFVLLLFCLYIGLYHGLFGLLVGLVAAPRGSLRRALVAAPFLWVAVELARTRITGFPWELLGYAQTSNMAVTRIAALTGVYGLSFEILLVNSAFAAAFLIGTARRKGMLAAALGAALVLQAGQWILHPAPMPADRKAVLVQPNIPIEADWTADYFQSTLKDLALISLDPPSLKPEPALPPELPRGGPSNEVFPDEHATSTAERRRYDLIVWPESPSPFFTNDVRFRDPVSWLAQQSGSWVIAGSIGIPQSAQPGGRRSEIFNSAALISPQGEWTARYDKVHLVPFGEYLPFPQIFGFAGGLTKEVGEFKHGTSRTPLNAGGVLFGTFICYESIFPDEVRRFARDGAQVLVNISNDGWYGDSGAWKQHLQQTRMRAIENNRWVLSATNTGLTAAIDPWGRVVAEVPRKERTVLIAPYARVSGTTFYTRHGDWFAALCAIISLGALAARFALPVKAGRTNS